MSLKQHMPKVPGSIVVCVIPVDADRFRGTDLNQSFALQQGKTGPFIDFLQMAPGFSDLFTGPPTSNSSASTSALADGHYPLQNFNPKGHVIENLAKDRLRAFTSGGQFSCAPSLCSC